jgi:diguanylate cyclase (GGDEF)-like protein
VIGDHDTPPTRSTRLLLVEDNRSQAMMIERMLELGNIELEVLHVGTLAEAKALLSESLVACVLLDLTLPDASELEGLMEIRHIAPETPVVVVTANNDVSRGVEAVQAGAQDYLVKGEMDTGHLCRAVRYAIERARSDLLLSHQALHDALTGLPNRVLFFDRVTYAMAQAAREATVTAVLFIDLDGFKPINDQLGHAAGDELLRRVAGRLLAWVRPGDVVSRFGGDEFTALIRNVEGPEITVAVAERLAEAVSQPISLGDEQVTVTPSIGIALGQPGEAPQAVIDRADKAMYVAKRSNSMLEIAPDPGTPEPSTKK